MLSWIQRDVTSPFTSQALASGMRLQHHHRAPLQPQSHTIPDLHRLSYRNVCRQHQDILYPRLYRQASAWAVPTEEALLTHLYHPHRCQLQLPLPPRPTRKTSPFCLRSSIGFHCFLSTRYPCLSEKRCLDTISPYSQIRSLNCHKSPTFICSVTL